MASFAGWGDAIKGSGSVTNGSTISLTTLAGEWMVSAMAHSYPPTTPTLADDQGNTWTRVVTQQAVNGYYWLSIFVAPVTTPGATVVTASMSFWADWWFVARTTALFAATPVPSYNGADNASTAVGAGTVTPTKRRSVTFLIVLHNSSTSITPGAGFTQRYFDNTTRTLLIATRDQYAARPIAPTATAGTTGAYGYSFTVNGDETDLGDPADILVATLLRHLAEHC